MPDSSSPSINSADGVACHDDGTKTPHLLRNGHRFFRFYTPLQRPVVELSHWHPAARPQISRYEKAECCCAYSTFYSRQCFSRSLILNNKWGQLTLEANLGFEEIQGWCVAPREYRTSFWQIRRWQCDALSDRRKE